MCARNHWAPGRVAFRLKVAPVKIRILYSSSLIDSEMIAVPAFHASTCSSEAFLDKSFSGYFCSRLKFAGLGHN